MTTAQRQMSETRLMESIREICKLYRLHAFHCQDSRGSWGPGFPDLVIAGPCGVLFREIKTEAGRTTVGQDGWAATLIEAGADWAIWRPADLITGRIGHELGKLAGR